MYYLRPVKMRLRCCVKTKSYNLHPGVSGLSLTGFTALEIYPAGFSCGKATNKIDARFRTNADGDSIPPSVYLNRENSLMGFTDFIAIV